MVTDLMPDEIGISVSYPLPGTKFYNKVKDELGKKANWADSDDLDLMFTGTFQPAYYKKLHRYVHKVYRTQQGLKFLKEVFQHPTTISKRKIKRMASTLYYGPTSLWNKHQLNKLELQK